MEEPASCLGWVDPKVSANISFDVHVFILPTQYGGFGATNRADRLFGLLASAVVSEFCLQLSFFSSSLSTSVFNFLVACVTTHQKSIDGWRCGALSFDKTKQEAGSIVWFHS